MGQRCLIPLLAALLLASCTHYVPSVTEVTMLAGETTTITITQYHYDPSFGSSTSGVHVESSDPSILLVEQDPRLSSPNVTLHALQPGTAYVLLPDASKIVTVHIGRCAPVGILPRVAIVQTLVGSPVELRIITVGSYPNATTWYEDVGGSWLQIPFATDNVYGFTPRVSGTFHFQARYSDRCGEVSTVITVVASTRGRAVRR